MPPRPLLLSICGSSVCDMVDYDAELRLYHEVLHSACGVRAQDHVLDIGCGHGLTTRDAARQAVVGSALGVDQSASAVERARRLARAQGLRNIAFECADAQTYPFPDGRFDLAISRCGVMFFRDPVAAFANIGRALRSDGRLVMMIWQAREHNEWAMAIADALAASAPADPGAADPFSLGDPRTVTATLRAAGFVDVTFTDVRRPVYYGPDIDAALAWVRGFTDVAQALDGMEPPAAEQAVGRLRDMLAGHLSAESVWLGSSAWIVAARRGEVR